jgi:hypothetical protein
MGHDFSGAASEKERVPTRTKVESCGWDTPDHSVSRNGQQVGQGKLDVCRLTKSSVNDDQIITKSVWNLDEPLTGLRQPICAPKLLKEQLRAVVRVEAGRFSTTREKNRKAPPDECLGAPTSRA